VLRSGRNPFQLYLLAACVLSGLAGLFAPASESAVVARSLPGWAVMAWYSALVAGATVSIVGVLTRGVGSLLIERVGLAMLAGFTMLYSGLVFVDAPRGTFSALFLAAFAAACVGRFLQIGRDLKRAEAVEQSRTEGPGGE
jgi:hypothetical protein